MVNSCSGGAGSPELLRHGTLLPTQESGSRREQVPGRRRQAPQTAHVFDHGAQSLFGLGLGRESSEVSHITGRIRRAGGRLDTSGSGEGSEPDLSHKLGRTPGSPIRSSTLSLAHQAWPTFVCHALGEPWPCVLHLEGARHVRLAPFPSVYRAPGGLASPTLRAQLAQQCVVRIRPLRMPKCSAASLARVGLLRRIDALQRSPGYHAGGFANGSGALGRVLEGILQIWNLRLRRATAIGLRTNMVGTCAHRWNGEPYLRAYIPPTVVSGPRSMAWPL